VAVQAQSRTEVSVIVSEKRAIGNELTNFAGVAETVIFTLAFTPIQQLFVNTVGRILDFIDYLLGFTDSTPIGDILRVIWTPDPFWAFFKSKLLISNMRIKGARVELRISFSDAYFRMIEVKLYGFWSLKFSEFKRKYIEKQKVRIGCAKKAPTTSTPTFVNPFSDLLRSS
jgi:hypothetical protein